MTETTTTAHTAEQLVARARRAVEILRETLTAAPPGPWTPIWEHCDCEGGCYCDGAYVHAIRFPEPITFPAEGNPVRDFHHEGSVEIPPAAAQLACLMSPEVSTAVANYLAGYVTSWDRSTGEAREILANTDSWIRGVTPLVDAILKVTCPDCLARWDVHGGPGWCCPAAMPAEVDEEAGR